MQHAIKPPVLHKQNKQIMKAKQTAEACVIPESQILQNLHEVRTLGASVKVDAVQGTHVVLVKSVQCLRT